MSHEYTLRARTAMQHLAANDPKLAPIIAAVGEPRITPHTDYYWELVDAIISQQLSVKAAHTIEQRFLALFDGEVPEPHQILGKTIEDLRAVGLSRAKANYVLDLATRIKNGELEIEKLPKLTNDQIIAELTAVKGIGEWTAHMFLLFALGRLDILPVGDLGIKNGVQKVYGLPTLPTAIDIQAIAAKNNWHPYESIASWYMWQSLELKD